MILYYNVFQGVTFELVKQVPDIYTESEWFAQIEANMDEESETLKETFMDNYSKAVTAVENLIFTEKGRQKEILTEMILRQEELQHEKMIFSLACPESRLAASRCNT